MRTTLLFSSVAQKRAGVGVGFRSFLELAMTDLNLCTAQTTNKLVWFPDPSVMRMRGRGKKGLGNNYTPARTGPGI